jgi:type III secretion system low calcium response chaperone LcrH/SycD
MIADIASPIDAAATKLAQGLDSLPHTRRLTDADAEAVYAVAHGQFGQGRYDEALRSFQLLLVYRPTHTVYLLGAALCLQRMRRYDVAAAAYTALSLLEPQQPSHLLALAECQLLNQEPAQARETLTQLTDLCHGQPGHDLARARARAMLELMRAHDEPHDEPAAA